MANDPLLLQYLKSIDERTQKMDEKLDDYKKDSDGRISSLENSRSKLRGVMAAVPILSGIAGWLGGHHGG